MALVLRNIYKFYDYHFNVDVDERIKDLFLIKSPWPVFGIILLYLFFVNGKGQQWMSDRKAFELNGIINIYNAMQVILNLYLGIGATFALLELNDLNILCIPEARKILTESGRKIVYFSHLYFLIKVVDLLDTIFFILRKKNNQVTFLHIYHHTIMVVGCYIYIKFMVGGGQPISLGIINSFVHVVMYAYYFLTSFKPELKTSIWWKKHITQLQMMQFAILIVHFLMPLLTECDYPKSLSAGIAFQNLFMFVLFADFYYKAYVKKVK